MKGVNRIEALARSAFFDKSYYESEASTTFADRRSAIAHYLEIGYKKNFNPSAAFDTAYYLSSHADVAAGNINPLLHYVLYGKAERRKFRPAGTARAPKPVAPDPGVWEDLARNRATLAEGAEPEVDVVIPVYRGYDDTLACLHSVLTARNETSYRIVVIDDCSPEPDLSRALVEVARHGLITLLRNEANRGFVGSVNRGIAHGTASDVILLNSDTIVYDDWIDRLRRHARAGDDVASVTPFSNNATIFSYPNTNQSNNDVLELPYDALDSLFARTNRGMPGIAVPTGVGFCFYLPRHALNVIGAFDEALFGKGYGEENDYCFRAMEMGFRNLAAPDVFVRHTGEVSFASESASGKTAGGRQLLAVHPRYDAAIQEFIARDPFEEARRRVDLARFARLSGGRGVVFVEHGWGGGIERHTDDLALLLRAEAIPTLRLKPGPDGKGLAFSGTDASDFPNLPSVAWSALSTLGDILRRMNLSHVHIHSLVGLDRSHFPALKEAILGAGLTYIVTLHDYVPVCPRMSMVDWSGVFCDSPNADYCQICIDKIGSPFGEVDVAAWRSDYGALLGGAASLIAPSADVAARYRRMMPGLAGRIVVRAHPYARAFAPESVRRPDGAATVVGVVGAIGQNKGSAVLHMLAVDALARNLPIRFVIYGYTSHVALGRMPNVRITGAYQEDDLVRVIDERPCDVILYSSIGPETFCYALDVAFTTGILPIAFDLGAPGDRIRSAPFGTVLPLALIYDPAGLNDAILNLVDRSAPGRSHREDERQWTGAAQYYG